MADRVITDISKVERGIYIFKLDGIRHIARVNNHLSCPDCMIKNCYFTYNGKKTIICRLLTNHFYYQQVASLVKCSLIYISKIRNGR